MQTPHAVLAGLFGRVPHPDLQISVSFLSMRRMAGQFACSLALDVSVINNGRGIAEQLFLGVEMELPPNCYDEIKSPSEAWDGWKTKKDNRIHFAMISNSLSLPPDFEKMVLKIELRIHNPDPGDIVIDFTWGSRNGPGGARSITLPADLMAKAIEHYLQDYPNEVLKKAWDQKFEAQFSACLASPT